MTSLHMVRELCLPCCNRVVTDEGVKAYWELAEYLMIVECLECNAVTSFPFPSFTAEIPMYGYSFADKMNERLISGRLGDRRIK